MARDFRCLGVMLDMSRNAVMRPEEVIRFGEMLGDMGYNTLMLYTEDTYEIREEPYFGYLRGRYSEKELRAIAASCEKAGVELVPCVQTLAHLNAVMNWPRFQKIRDTADILLAAEEETYVFIDRLFASLRRCFKSRLVNIGMDEAHMVGLGKYLDRHGFENRYDILTRHLARVCDLAKKHGFTPLMWSDMFFRLANHGVYAQDKPVLPVAEVGELPKDLSLVYWEYYSADPRRLNGMLAAHKKLGREVWFAGGAWSWTGFAPHNRWTLKATRAAIRACRANGVENFLVTLWGDNGAECSRLALLPSLFAGAEMARGNEDMAAIRQKFKEKYGLPFDAFLKLDLLAPNPGRTAGESVTNPEKMYLYNEPCLGIFDPCLAGDEGERFAAAARSLARYKNDPNFGILFRKEWALCRVLANKATLGLDLRRAYQAGDKEALSAQIARIRQVEKDLAVFHRVFREAWFRENKPHGFDVQDIRLGGLAARLAACRERLEDYLLTGKEIPELREELLPPTEKLTWFNRYANNATVNPL